MTSFRDRDPVRVGIISLVGLALVLGLVFEFKNLPFIAGTYTLQAQFADAAGLNPGNDVRVAGIKVGSVKHVELGRDRVTVTFGVSRGIDIPRDATAEISLKTILGTKFIVIHATSDAPPLKDGGTIPLANTSIPFEIYQVGNATVDLLTDVDGKQLNDAFAALANATKDPHRNLARTLQGAAKVLQTLGGKRSAIDEVISRGEQILETLDASSPDIQGILQHANVVMEVLARRRTTVQALLHNTDKLAAQLGGLIRDKRPQLDTILNDLHTTLAIVDASLAQLEEAVRLLGPSTESFARVFHNGRWASICTMALEATVLPLPPPLPSSISVGTGPGGSPTGPVDCPFASAASSAVGLQAGTTRRGVQ